VQQIVVESGRDDEDATRLISLIRSKACHVCDGSAHLVTLDTAGGHIKDDPLTSLVQSEGQIGIALADGFHTEEPETRFQAVRLTDNGVQKPERMGGTTGLACETSAL
jgi:hypothetical protein